CGHFRAAYKNMFGVSFHKDLIQSRISLAKFLLITTALSLPAIAAKCGYEDDKYFMRQFRQHTGTSPNVYRKFESSSFGI
ncbi:MAG: AraC family transcriptional regulator, partial [Ruminococcus sp.]|nr:AraC family transcriptional regulator [Ruminococcus sp.]